MINSNNLIVFIIIYLVEYYTFIWFCIYNIMNIYNDEKLPTSSEIEIMNLEYEKAKLLEQLNSKSPELEIKYTPIYEEFTNCYDKIHHK